MSLATRVVGRLHGDNTSEGTRVYLYLLLFHKRGATNFEDLVTVTKPYGSIKTFFEQNIGGGGVWRDTTKPDYRKQLKNLVLSPPAMRINFSCKKPLASIA